MAVSKDTEKGTGTSQIWVEDWQGKKKHKKKRGFASKKEALNGSAIRCWRQKQI